MKKKMLLISIMLVLLLMSVVHADLKRVDFDVIIRSENATHNEIRDVSMSSNEYGFETIFLTNRFVPKNISGDFVSKWRLEFNDPFTTLFSNITNGMDEVLSVCSGLDEKLTESISDVEKTTALEKERAEFQRLWKIEEERRTSCEANLEEQKGSIEDIEEKYNICTAELESTNNQLSFVRQDTESLNICEDDLEEEKSKRNNSTIIAFAAGALISWFAFGKKKKTGPSEQSESNSYGDDVIDEREYA